MHSLLKFLSACYISHLFKEILTENFPDDIDCSHGRKKHFQIC